MGNRYRVFYECWQMECCGIPFSVGDSVKWTVCRSLGMNTSVKEADIEYCYEAHSETVSGLLFMEGIVETLDILYECYELSDDKRVLLPVGGRVFPLERAEGFDKDRDGMKASGYIVTLDCTCVRPAEKSDATYI